MGKIFLTSDTHFFHNKDFVYAERGYKTIEEMNEDIIRKWNAKVGSEDIVYHCGDVALSADIQSIVALLKRLNGKIFLAYGNHDTDNRLKAYKESGVFEDIQMGYRFTYKKKHFVATHYQTITSNMDDIKVINLHGHTHQSNYTPVENIFQGFFHVGLDSNNNELIELDTIIEKIKEIKNA